jgi:hypothetical protein
MSAVGVLSVSNPDHQHNDHIILDVGDYSISTHAIFPETG